MASLSDGISPTQNEKKKPGLAETFTKALARGTDVAQANLFGAGAAVGDATGLTGLRNFGEAGMQSNLQEASQYNSEAPSFKEAVNSYGTEGISSGLQNTALWGANVLGEQAPQVAQSLITYAAGKKLGNRLGDEGSAMAGNTANIVGNTAQEAGSIYGDILDQTGERQGERALQYGAAAGLIDSATEALPLGRVFGGKHGQGNVLTDAAKAGLQQIATEAPTEYIQTGIEQAAVSRTDPEQRILTPEKELERREAAAAGALAGGVSGAGSELASRAYDKVVGYDANGRPIQSQEPIPYSDQEPTQSLASSVQPTVNSDFSNEDRQPIFKDTEIDPVASHVQQQQAVAESVDPSAGVISRAVNLGAQTGAVAQKAEQEVIEKIASGDPLPQQQEKPNEKVMQTASNEESTPISSAVAKATEQATPATNAAPSSIANERPPVAPQEIDQYRTTGSMAFEDGAPRQIPDHLADADPEVKRAWYHGWDKSNLEKPVKQEAPETNSDMQNRDRSRAASVAQMAGIANKPDFDRLSESKTPESGAPMAYMAGDQIDTLPAVGRDDVVVFEDGQKVPVKYAVVEAGTLQASHDAYGKANPSYAEDLQPGQLRALNNGRTAGLQAAYDNLSADEYRANLTNQADRIGVDPAVIASMDSPVLIRLYSENDNTPNMGARSNASAGLGLSPSEQANTDASLLGHLDDIHLTDDGEFNPSSNLPLIQRFMRQLPATESGKLTARDGTPTEDLSRRLKNAILAMAYKDANLVETATESTESRNLMQSLNIAAPRMATLPDDDSIGLRKLVSGSAQMLRKAKQAGTTVQQTGAQMDITGGFSPEEEALATFMEENIRTPRKLGEALALLADYAHNAHSSRDDMFGDSLEATKQAAFAYANQKLTEGNGNGAKQIRNERQQEAGIQRDGESQAQSAHEGASGRTDGSSDGEGQEGRPQAELTPADDFALESYTNEEIAAKEAAAKALTDKEEQAAKDAENKAKADAAVDTFSLSGSLQPADLAMAAGQKDIFSQPQTMDLLAPAPDKNKDLVEPWLPILKDLNDIVSRFEKLASPVKGMIENRAVTLRDGIKAAVETGKDLLEMPPIDDAKKFVENAKAQVEKQEAAKVKQAELQPTIEASIQAKREKYKAEGNLSKPRSAAEIISAWDFDPAGIAYAKANGIDFSGSLESEFEDARKAYNDHDIYDLNDSHRLPADYQKEKGIGSISGEWKVFFKNLASVDKQDGRTNMLRTMGQIAKFEEDHLNSQRGWDAFKAEGLTRTGTEAPASTEEPNLVAARALIDRYRTAVGNKLAEGKIKKEALALAATIDPDQLTAAAMSLDILFERLGVHSDNIKWGEPSSQTTTATAPDRIEYDDDGEPIITPEILEKREASVAEAKARMSKRDKNTKAANPQKVDPSELTEVLYVRKPHYVITSVISADQTDMFFYTKDGERIGKDRDIDTVGKALVTYPDGSPLIPDDKSPLEAVIPHDGWRDHLIKARQYAIDLGMADNVEDWSDLDSIVEAIDIHLTEDEYNKADTDSIDDDAAPEAIDTNEWRKTKSGVMFKAKELGIDNPQRAMAKPDEVMAEIDAILNPVKAEKAKDDRPKISLVDGSYYNNKKKKPWMTKDRAERALNAHGLGGQYMIVPADGGARGYILSKKETWPRMEYYSGEYTHKDGYQARIIRPANMAINSETAKLLNGFAKQHGWKFRSGDAAQYGQDSKIEGGFFEINNARNPDDFIKYGLVESKRLGGGAEYEASPMIRSKNTIFTEEAADKAREILRKKLNGSQLNSGVDPEVLQAGMALAGYHIEKGARTFAAYSKAMVDDLGDFIKPYLKSWYMGIKYDPKAAGFDGMSSASEVELADVDQIKAGEEEDAGTEVQTGETLGEAIERRYDDITDNNKLKSVLAEFHGQPATEDQIKKGQEALEAVIVTKARDIVQLDDSLKNTFNALVKVYNAQPLLNSRTSTSISQQAYSTPAPLAYIASRLAGITDRSSVLEPTAGNGMLLIGADEENVFANELNDRRAESLRNQGFTVTQHNAAETGDLTGGEKVDAVIMNPPFGSLKTGDTKVDGYTIKKIDHLIAAKALESMKDNGSAVMIIGSNKESGVISAGDKIFFNWLYSHYNVVDHFEADGNLYARQGAGWPVSVITIQGRQQSDKLSPASGTVQRLETWESIYDHASATLDSFKSGHGRRSESSTVSAVERTSDQSKPTIEAKVKNSRPGKEPREGKRAGVGVQDGGITGSNAGRLPDGDNSNGAGGTDSGKRVGAVDHKLSAVETDSATGESRSDKQSEGNGSGGNGSSPSSSRISASDFQSQYKSGSSLHDDNVLVPVNMRSALNEAIKDLKKNVGGDIDAYLMDKLKYDSKAEYEKSFMALQADGVAAAIYNMEVKNKGIIIADQTGVGKGRQAAAIMRYAIKNGKIPVFVTEKPNLFTDMYNDSLDIFMKDVKPFIFNNTGGYVRRNEESENLFAIKPAAKKAHISNMAATGEMPEDYNSIFITYSQLASSTIMEKRNAMYALKEKYGDKVVFILDESHNVAGEQSSIKKVKGIKTVVTSTAGVFNHLIQNSGIVYLSATYAKRPDNMPIYHRTDIMDSVDTASDLVNAITAGGEALQTVISNMLTRSGQLWRREKSFEGIEIKTIIDQKNREKHERLSDEVTSGLRAIIAADNALSEWLKEGGDAVVMEAMGIAGGSGSHFGGQVEQHAEHSPFTSVVHNYVRQLQLALKADWIADEAIALHKAGKKPVIAFENTMGSFLGDAISDDRVKLGDEWDGNFSSILEQALYRTKSLSIQNAMGDSTRHPIPDFVIPSSILRQYESAIEIIEGLDISDIPVMHIDYVRNKLEKAGIRTGEITGRQHVIDHSGDTPVVSMRSKSELSDRRGTVDKFNAGEIDAIFLNVAGATGLSIHAKKGFKDTKPRHMLIAQTMLDVNKLMQMLGRINRTGQIVLPEFSLMGLDLPSEKRPLAIANMKLKSLNANTSANTGSDTSLNAPDIMNKYGAMVINDFMAENMDIANAIGFDVSTSSENFDPAIAIKATGRMALLPVATQKYAYDAIESAYKEHIAFLDATGQNDLVSKNIDADAKIINTTKIYEGKNPGSLMGGNTYLHHVDIKRIGKPPTPEKVSQRIDQYLDGKTPAEAISSMMDPLLKAAENIEMENAQALEVMKLEIKAEPDPAIRKKLSDRVEVLTSHRNDTMDDARRTTSIINEMKAGARVKLDIGDELVDAVVVGITSSYSEGTGYPLSRSKFKVTFAVNAPSQFVSFPLSKLMSPTSGIINSDFRGDELSSTPEAIARVFNSKNAAASRERRYIATGNLIGGFSQLGSGKVVVFTAANGKEYQGILMPRKYKSEDAEALLGKPKSIRDADIAARYLAEMSYDDRLATAGLYSEGQYVRVTKNKNDYTISVPKKTTPVGDKIKFDTELHAILGSDFAGRGSILTARITDRKMLDAALAHIISKAPLFVPASGQAIVDRMSGKATDSIAKTFEIDNMEDSSVVYDGSKHEEEQFDLGEPVSNEAPSAIESNEPAAENKKGITIVEGNDTRNNDKNWTVKIEKRLGDDYASVSTLARRNNGFWSRFTKGFLFKTAKDAQSFVDSVDGGGFLHRRTEPVMGGKTITREKAQEIVDRFVGQYKGTANLGFTLYDTKEQAYGTDSLKRQKLESAVLKGAYKQGKIHLILADHKDEADLLDTIRHEAWAHFGFDLVSPERKAEILKSVKSDIESNGSLASIMEKVKRNYRAEDGSLPSEEKLLEEAVAMIAEQYGHRIEDQSMESGLRATIRRIFETIMDSLRSVGLARYLRKDDGIKMAVQFLTDSARTQRGEIKGRFDNSKVDLNSMKGDGNWYYSALKEAAADMLQNKGTPEQMLAMLARQKGVKPAEIEATGLKEYLELQGKSVTKQQIVDYLANNGVQVQETMLGSTESGSRKDQILAELKALGYKAEPELGGDYIITRNDEDVDYDDLPDDVQTLVDGLGDTEGFDYGSPTGNDTEFGQYVLPGGKNYRELLLTLPTETEEYQSGWNVRNKNGVIELATINESKAKARAEEIGGTVEPEMASRPKGSAFKSSHYGQPNILAHVRFNERETPMTTDIADVERRLVEAVGTSSPKNLGSGAASHAVKKGMITEEEAIDWSKSKGMLNEYADKTGTSKRVLFIEEIQSDWAQAGRKEGFRREIDDSAYDPGFGRNVTIASRLQQAKEIEENLPALRAEAEKFMRGIYKDLGVEIEKNERAQSTLADETKWASFQQNMVTDRESPIAKYLSSVGLAKMWRKEAEGIRSARQKEQESLPPSAPFVTSTDAWVGLSMKRMIAYAAENGFDRIAWTTGEQQADRYDMSKQVKDIQAHKNKDGSYSIRIHPLNAGMINKENISAQELSDTVGKDLAGKIIEDTADTNKMLEYSGLDLKVGGEGMKSFYDKIVPNVAKEVTKKMGGQLSAIQMEAESQYDFVDEHSGSGAGFVLLDRNTYKYLADAKHMTLAIRRADGQIFSSRDEATKAAASLSQVAGKLEQTGFDITPEMRDAVESGLPLFRKGGSSTQAVDSPLYKTRTAEQVGAVTKAKSDEALKVDATAQKILAKGNTIKAGDLVGVRLNINVLNRTGVPVQSIHKGGEGIRKKMPQPGNQSGFYNGEVLTYLPVATLKNAFFTVHQPMREKIASGSSSKAPMASVDGEWVETDSPNFDGVLARFNPGKDHLFIDQKGRVIKSAEEATVMGHRAYLRGEIEYYAKGEEPTKAGASPTTGILYDPAVPPETLDDLFFRRAAEGDQSALDSLKVMAQDRFAKDLNTFGWWHKSVGTQFHKAWKDKDYKKVFDQAQYYLNDTNRFAMESADMAPGLLPKVDSLSDIFKSTGASRADIESIADPIYKGTLIDEKVYSRDELVNQFNLSPKQVGLYTEFRKAINHSLNSMVASEIAAEIKDDPELHSIVMMAKYRPERALDEVIETLQSRAEDLEAEALRIEKSGASEKLAKPYRTAANQARKQLVSAKGKLDKLNELKQKGYAPLMRFGKYTVTVQNDLTGAIEYFEMFESQSDARKMEREMQAAWAGSASVSTGVMSQEAFKIYAGMSPDTLDLFGSAIGFDKSQSDVFQDYLRLSRNNRSALKRLIKRKGTDGFSKDVTRSLASFITSNSRQASSNWHMGEMDKKIEELRSTKKHKGDVIDEAVKLVDYLRNPREEAAGLRNLLFINFIGGSIASAITNMTQPIIMTAPYLSQFGSATKHLLAAQKIAVGANAEGELGKAMTRAIDEGLLAPHEVYQLHSEAIRNLGSTLWVRKAITAWGRPFALAEAYNRRLTFAAAYNIAKENPDSLKKSGVSSAYAFAVKAVQETQGIYNKGNRPNWGRGALGATVFTFKQYSIGYLEFVRRLPRKQQLQALGLLFLMAGLNGLPFADDLEDLIDTIAQSMGYNLHTKSALRNTAIGALGKNFGEFISNGVSALPGSPLDVQARMGLGNLIPGTGILKKSSTDRGRDATEALGAVGGLIQQIGKGATKMLSGDLSGAAKAAAPVAVRNALSGANMISTGKYTDEQGRLISSDVSALDGVIKMTGFNPSRIAGESRNVQGERQKIALARQTESGIADSWAESVVEKDDGKRQAAMESLREWNRKNPETPIRITPAQIRSRVMAMSVDRKQRLMKTAPREMRSSVIQGLE